MKVITFLALLLPLRLWQLCMRNMRYIQIPIDADISHTRVQCREGPSLGAIIEKVFNDIHQRLTFQYSAEGTCVYPPGFSTW